MFGRKPKNTCDTLTVRVLDLATTTSELMDILTNEMSLLRLRVEALEQGRPAKRKYVKSGKYAKKSK